ncbi:MAG TPA: hypothetical protein VN960_05040 [Gaiellaceae bacterium]|nr:hypothetical protein [Gaiellaceae bacterium]
MKGILLVVLLVLAGCSSSETETVEITTTVQATTTVEAAAPTVATTTAAPAGNDPDDVDGQLDIRNLNATRTGDLLAVSLATYEPWSSNVLVGPALGEQGPNRITIFYDVDLDGQADYRGRMIWGDGELALRLSGSGSEFEPIPIERPDNVTAQFVHPVDVFFVPSGGSSEVDIQIRAKSLYNGREDRVPDAGNWLRVPFNP